MHNSAGREHDLHQGAHRVRGWIFFCAILLCPLVYSFYFTSFLHPKEMLLLLCLAGMGVCTIAGHKTRDDWGIWRGSVWVLLLAAATPLLIFIGQVWPGAAVPVYVSSYGMALVVFFLVAVWSVDLVSDNTWQGRFWNAAVLSGVGVAALALGQYTGVLEFMFPVFPGYTQPAYSVFGNQSLLGSYMAVVAPMLLHRMLEREHAMRSFAVMLAALALLLLTLALSGSRSAWLAAAVGIALIFWWHRSRVKWNKHLLPIAGLGALVAIANAPFLWARAIGTLAEGDIGGRARLWFWDGTLRMIAEHPWTGVGLGNFKYWSPYYQGLALDAPGGEAYFHNPLHTVHAHNEYLEFAAEAGVVGVMLMLVFLNLLWKGRGVAWVPLISLGICAGFNATLHSAPHALLGLYFCACLVPVKAAQAPHLHAVRYGALAAELALLCAVLVLGAAFYTSSFLQARAEWAHLQPGIDPLPLYGQAESLDKWPNHVLYESHGIALLEAGNPAEAARMFAMAREGLDTGRVHYLSGSAALALGDADAAAEHYRRALFRWPGEQDVFDALWEVVDEAERNTLRKHAGRFGLAIPGEGQT